MHRERERALSEDKSRSRGRREQATRVGPAADRRCIGDQGSCRIRAASEPISFGPKGTHADRYQEAHRRSRAFRLGFRQGCRVIARKGDAALLETEICRRKLYGYPQLALLE